MLLGFLDFIVLTLRVFYLRCGYFNLLFQWWVCYGSTEQRRLHKYCTDLGCVVCSSLNTAMVETLILKTKTWEEERGVPFMFDGVHLFSRTCLSFASYFWGRLLLEQTSIWLLSCLLGLPVSYNWGLYAGEVALYAGWIQLPPARERWGEAQIEGEN